MSGFWDAVGRAALGLSGTAVPRPRSIFEPDVPSQASGDIETIEDEVGVATAAPASAAAQVPFTSTPQPARVAESPLSDRPLAAEQEAPDDERRRSEPAPPEPRPRGQASPGAIVDEPRPEAQGRSESLAVDRIETRRLETTTHVVIESITSAKQDERPGPLPPASAPLPTASEMPEVGEPVESTGAPETEAPLAVVAEPHMVVTESASVTPVPQEPPLIIEIDRIDIRIESDLPAPSPPPRRPDPGSVPSLAEYLAGRSGAPR